jgi:hypothetical protein
MTSVQRTITGELRKWQVKVMEVGSRRGIITGKMYNDTLDIWEDGDDAVIHFTDFVESANFYLAVTHHSCLKCMKDEERKDAPNYIPFADRKNGPA